jgi:hypothetical protein
MTAIIGIDPHKTTHIAVAIDGDEGAIARLEVRARRSPRRCAVLAIERDERVRRSRGEMTNE